MARIFRESIRDVRCNTVARDKKDAAILETTVLPLFFMNPIRTGAGGQEERCENSSTH